MSDVPITYLLPERLAFELAALASVHANGNLGAMTRQFMMRAPDPTYVNDDRSDAPASPALSPPPTLDASAGHDLEVSDDQL